MYHNYTYSNKHNNDEVKTALYRMATLSVFSGVLISYLLSNIGDTLQLTSFNLSTLAPPSTFIIFLMLYKIVDKWLWKTPVRHLLGISIPNFNGSWTGHGEINEADGNKLKREGLKLNIDQSWRNISICITGTRHSSYSIAASCVARAHRFDLHYLFMSEKTTSEAVTHRGATNLKITAPFGKCDLSQMELLSFTEYQTVNTFIFIKDVS